MKPVDHVFIGACLLVAMSIPAHGERGPMAAPSDSEPLVEVRAVNSRIRVDMRYGSRNNFTGKVLYACNRCYLRKETARKLDQAQRVLEAKGFGLKVWDCYRPLSVQKTMWELVPDRRYVADPRTGSRHNRGGAVDVTLVDANGSDVPMPTGFDDFSPRARSDNQQLPRDVIGNRSILNAAMTGAGFTPLATEWWHYDDSAGKELPILDIPLDGALCR